MNTPHLLFGAVVAAALSVATAHASAPLPLGFPQAEQVGTISDSVVFPPIQYRGKSSVGTTVRYIIFVYRTSGNTIEYTIDVDAATYSGDTWVFEEAIPIPDVLNRMAMQALSHGGDGVTMACTGIWSGSFIDGSEVMCRWIGGVGKETVPIEGDGIELN